MSGGQSRLPPANNSTLLDWLRVEYAIEKPSNKLLAATELDSDTWVAEVKRIQGKKQPLTAAGVHALRDEYTCTARQSRQRDPAVGEHRQKLGKDCWLPPSARCGRLGP